MIDEIQQFEILRHSENPTSSTLEEALKRRVLCIRFKVADHSHKKTKSYWVTVQIEELGRQNKHMYYIRGTVVSRHSSQRFWAYYNPRTMVGYLHYIYRPPSILRTAA